MNKSQGLAVGIALACICLGVTPSTDTSILYCREEGNCIALPEYLPPREGWNAIETRSGNGLLKTAAALAALVAFSHAHALARAAADGEPQRQKFREVWEQTDLSKVEMLAAEGLRQFNNQLTQNAAEAYFAALPPPMQAQLMGATYEQTVLPAADDSVQNPAPVSPPSSDEKALRLLDSAVTTNRSTLLVGATGTGKSVTDGYILHKFRDRFPNAEIWAIAQKNDSFNGLDRRGRVVVFDVAEPQSSFAPIDKIWEIYEQRRKVREKDRDFRDRPVRLKLADWHSIYNSCRSEKWFAPYLQKLSTLITVGREFNIALLVDTQSFNLSALGLAEDSNIRQNLNILAQGYSWKDNDGNIQGDYGVLTNLIGNRYIVSDNEVRAQLNEQLKELKLQNKPVLFSAIEPPTLALVPDIRHYKNRVDIDSNEGEREALERIYQLEMDVSQCENAKPERENTKPSQDKGSSHDAKTFTRYGLPYEIAKALVAEMRKSKTKGQIIEELWGVKPGRSKTYDRALEEFKELEQ